MEVAEVQRRAPVIETLAVSHAWDLFEDGDLSGYANSIAMGVDSLSPTIDVVVLAQASMAIAVERCRTTATVLSSPRSAVEAAVALA